MNALRNVVLSNRDCLTNCDVLKEIYLHKNHSICNEDRLIKFFMDNGATHKEINESMQVIVPGAITNKLCTKNITANSTLFNSNSKFCVSLFA